MRRKDDAAAVAIQRVLEGFYGRQVQMVCGLGTWGWGVVLGTSVRDKSS